MLLLIKKVILNYKIVSKPVDTPPTPYYIGVHIHACSNNIIEGQTTKCRKN